MPGVRQPGRIGGVQQFLRHRVVEQCEVALLRWHSGSFTDLYTKRWCSYAGCAQRGWVEEVGWHSARRDERVRVGPAAPHRSAATGVPTVGLPRHGEERVRIQVQPPGDGDRPAVASLDAYSQ